jgi:hypothetical protein
MCDLNQFEYAVGVKDARRSGNSLRIGLLDCFVCVLRGGALCACP